MTKDKCFNFSTVLQQIFMSMFSMTKVVFHKLSANTILKLNFLFGFKPISVIFNAVLGTNYRSLLIFLVLKFYITNLISFFCTWSSKKYLGWLEAICRVVQDAVLLRYHTRRHCRETLCSSVLSKNPFWYFNFHLRAFSKKKLWCFYIAYSS